MNPKPESTAVATVQEKKVPAIVQLLDAAGDRLLPLVPDGISYDRIKSEVYFAVRKMPAIAECTPDSIVRAVGTALRRDLVIGETIHLVPTQESYKDAAGNWQKRQVLNAWNDYKGDIELVMRSGAAQDVTAKAVYENEHFEYHEGMEPHLVHHPAMSASDRGKLIGAYCRFRVRFGYYKVCWLPIADIEAVRAKSKSWAKEPTCPPWYAIKTAIHQGCKLLPKNPRLAALLMEMREEDEEVFDPALEVAPQRSDAKQLPRPTMLAGQDEEREPVAKVDLAPLNGDFFGEEDAA